MTVTPDDDRLAGCASALYGVLFASLFLLLLFSVLHAFGVI